MRLLVFNSPSLAKSMTNSHTYCMTKRKVAITMDSALLSALDSLVDQRVFPNRSRAIQQAVQEKLDRLQQTRLARECAKLDPAFERSLAEEGLAEDLTGWPEY